MALGNVLHYDMPDAAYFAAKFRKRQEGILQKFFYLRYRLALVARNCSDSEIKEFFDDYIAIREPARIARLESKGILLRIDAVADFMKGRQGDAVLARPSIMAPIAPSCTGCEGDV
jgi:hypothetical protein